MSKIDTDEELKRLVDLGRSWGMSDSEITTCLKNEVSRSESGPPVVSNSSSKTKKSTTSSSFGGVVLKFLKFLILAPVLLIIAVGSLYLLLSTAASFSVELELALAHATDPYVYPVMRAIRIFSQPFVDYYNFAGYYNAECVVDNPFYVETIGDCNVCNHKAAFAYLPAKDVEKIQSHIDEMTPFVIRGYAPSKIDLLSLKKMYEENESRFILGGTTEFDSNLPSARNISDVLMNYDTNGIVNAHSGAGHLMWGTQSVPSAQAIRKLFPRPAFMFEQAEVSLFKRILIDGPMYRPYVLPIGGFANGWYQQALGTREVILSPHPECRRECQDISVIVEAGDIVYFQDQYWKLISAPVHETFTNELSIAFTGSFTY